MAYKINEIFVSIQGEGAMSGTPMTFVRFSGCNRACDFCDTEFASGDTRTRGELIELITSAGQEWVLLTGGEPLLQVDAELIDALKKHHKIALETNGSLPFPGVVDYVSMSPKVAEHAVALPFVDELRYPVHAGTVAVPRPSANAHHLFLSPIWTGDTLERANIAKAVELVKNNPPWRLSVQYHKFMGCL